MILTWRQAPYVCVLCGKTFAVEQDVLRHEQFAHEWMPRVDTQTHQPFVIAEEP